MWGVGQSPTYSRKNALQGVNSKTVRWTVFEEVDALHESNVIKLRKSSKGIRSMIERRKQTPDRIYQKKGMTKRMIKELPEKVLTQGKNYDNL